jgi:triosephosphate isomerase
MSDLKTPIFLTNLKTYPESTGDNACKLARIAEAASQKMGVQVIVAPQTCDIFRVSSLVRIPVFSQHVDPVEPGKHTGYTPIEAVKQAGAEGTLINHAEHQLTIGEIRYIIDRCRRVGVASFVCADTPEASAFSALLQPDAILFEPPELIGTGVSVSKAKPMSITQTVKLVRSVNSDVVLMCGAGIANGEDVKVAMQLGMQGVGVTNGFVKASDPQAALLEMLSMIK